MTYTKRWFAGQVGTSVMSAGVVAPIVMDLVRPTSVLDVGCGMGGWPAAFAKLGVQDVMGVDGDYVDRSMLQIPADRFKAHNLTENLNLGRSFDLAMSLEVAEHLPEGVADQFVDVLTRHAPVVLFSAAIPGQGGNEHINEQWQSYWAAKFESRGYHAADPIRSKVWDNEGVEWWYRQNMLLFVSDRAMAGNAKLRDAVAASGGMPMDVVHPGMMQQYLVAAAHPVRALAQQQVVRAKKTVKKFIGR